MKILAFDTASNNNDVAIVKDKKILSQNNIKDFSTQAETLVPSIEKCLNDANLWYRDLDLIAVTKGPGNFTGVRIGFTVAKTIKMTTNTPLVAINNLEAIAYDYVGNYKGNILVVLDAKLDEFFIQEFLIKSGQLKSKYDEPKLIKCQDINNHLPKDNFLIIGSGKEIAGKLIKDKESFTISTKEDCLSAFNLAVLASKIYKKNGKSKNAILYVRKPNITRSKI